MQPRVFCTHWNGLDKSGGSDDAVDDKEFDGDLIAQLLKSHDFVKMNSKARWKKMPDHRGDKPDYAGRAVFEALANALMHRDYDVIGSEIHVDMYDGRLEVYSPGGMVDGTLVQEREIDNVPSARRNPIIAEIFHRLDYIERRGSGLRKIRTETSYLYGYADGHAPQFVSTSSAFHVVLRNINYHPNKKIHYDTEGAVMDVVMENERMRTVLDHLGDGGSISAKNLAQKMKATDRTIQRDLEALKNAGIIRRVGGNRYGRWETTG